MKLNDFIRVLRKRVIERKLKQSIIWKNNEVLIFAEDTLFELLVRSNVNDASLVRVTFSDEERMNSLLKYFEEVFSLEKVNYCIALFQIPNFLFSLKNIKSDILIGNKFDKKMKRDSLQEFLLLLKEKGHENGLLINIDNSDITGISGLYKITSLVTKYNKQGIVLGIGVKQSRKNLVVDIAKLLMDFIYD